MIQSNCKLNIGLNILKKREDGYHELDMIMVPIDFSDVIKYWDYGVEGDLILETNNGNIPTDEKNTVSWQKTLSLAAGHPLSLLIAGSMVVLAFSRYS